MHRILIGTSGFSYNDWKGEFYPHEMVQKDFLEYYSHHFNAIELNFSYYKIPDAINTGKLVDRSGGRLEFVVKAFRGMTHEISGKSLTHTLPLFIKGLGPVIEAERLGAILLQFPQSFHYTTENRIYLKSLINELGHLPLAVEFRQKEWFKDSVFSAMEELGACFVCVDEPDLPSLLPPVALNTSSLGYIRFHGRNKKGWYGTDSRTRYDYLYSEAELKEWIPRIRDLASKTEKLYLFFNNHAKAQAVNNAKMLIKLLG